MSEIKSSRPNQSSIDNGVDDQQAIDAINSLNQSLSMLFADAEASVSKHEAGGESSDLPSLKAAPKPSNPFDGLPSPKASAAKAPNPFDSLPSPKTNAAKAPNPFDSLPSPKASAAKAPNPFDGLPSPKASAPVVPNLLDSLPSPKANIPKSSSPMDILPSPKVIAPKAPNPFDSLPSPKVNEPRPSVPNLPSLEPPVLSAPAGGMRSVNGLPSLKVPETAPAEASKRDSNATFHPAFSMNSSSSEEDRNNETLHPVFNINQPDPSPVRSRANSDRISTVAISSLDLDLLPDESNMAAVPPSMRKSGLHFPASFGADLETGGEQPIHEPVFGQSQTPAKAVNNDILGLFDEPFATQGATPARPILSDPIGVQPSAPQSPLDSLQSEKAPVLNIPTLEPEPRTTPAVDQIQAEPAISEPMAPVPPVPPVAPVAPAVPPVVPPEAASTEAAPEELFDIQSIQSDSVVSHPIAATRDSAAPASKRKRISPVIFAVAGIVFFIIAVSIAAIKFIHDEKTITEDELAVIPVEETVQVNWQLVSYDDMRSYRVFYQQALKRLKQQDITPEERNELQGQVMIAIALAQTHFASIFADDIEMISNSAETIANTCEDSWCTIGLWTWGKVMGNEEMADKFEPKLPDDDKFSTLIRVLKVVQAYTAWKPETQTFSERQKTADEILELVPVDYDLNELWPLYPWIRAKTLQRIGKFEESLKSFDKIKPDSDAALSHTSLLLLQTQSQLGLGQYDNVQKGVEQLLKLENKSQEEQIAIDTLKILMMAVLKPLSEFDTELSQFINQKENPNAPAIGFAACQFINQPALCHSDLNSLMDLNPTDLALRKQFIKATLLENGYETLVFPERPLDKLTLDHLDKTIAVGFEQAPDDIELLKLKGMLEYVRNQYDEANEAFDEVERSEDVVWGGTYLRLIENWSTLTKDQKEDNLKILMNNVSDMSDRADESIILTYVLYYIGEYESARKVIERAYGVHPDNTQILDALMTVALIQNDRETVEDMMKQLSHRNALMAVQEYEYARLLERLGETSTALEKMLVIVSKNENNSTFLSYTGQLFFVMDNYDSALPYFNQALALDASNAELHYYKGRCLYEGGHYENALMEFNEASSQNDLVRKYDLWIGLSLSRINQPTEAMRSFTSVIDTWTSIPKNERTETDNADAAEAYYYRAEVLKSLNRRDEAKKDFLRSLDLKPGDLHYSAGYAIFLYENNKYKDAVSLINTIESKVEKGEMNSTLYFVRGLSYLKLEDRKSAITNLEMARDKGFVDEVNINIIGIQDPAEVYERLGYLYRDSGKNEAAKASFKLFQEKAKSMSPATAREIQNELDKL